MNFTFTKEPGNLLPFPQTKQGSADELPPSLQKILADLTQHPDNYSAPGANHAPDADNYTLHVENQGKQWSFQFRDLAIPEAVQPLIDHLRQSLTGK